MLARVGAVRARRAHQGVVGIALPILALALYVAIARDFALLRRLHVGAGLAVFARHRGAVVRARGAAQPGVRGLLLHPRASDALHAAGASPRRAVVVLHSRLDRVSSCRGCRRWSRRCGTSANAPARRRARRAFDAQRFAWCSAAAILVFFSLSSSKLPAYIMPAIGAVALAAAVPLARRFDASLRHGARTLVVAGFVIGAAVWPAAHFVKVPMVRADLLTGTPWVMIAVVFLVGGGLVAFRLQARGLRLRALAVIAVSSIAACQCAARAGRAHRRVLLFGAPDRAPHGRREASRVPPGPALLQRRHVRSHRPVLPGAHGDARARAGRARVGYCQRASQLHRARSRSSRSAGAPTPTLTRS